MVTGSCGKRERRDADKTVHLLQFIGCLLVDVELAKKSAVVHHYTVNHYSTENTTALRSVEPVAEEARGNAAFDKLFW